MNLDTYMQHTGTSQIKWHFIFWKWFVCSSPSPPPTSGTKLKSENVEKLVKINFIFRWFVRGGVHVLWSVNDTIIFGDKTNDPTTSSNGMEKRGNFEWTGTNTKAMRDEIKKMKKNIYLSVNVIAMLSHSRRPVYKHFDSNAVVCVCVWRWQQRNVPIKLILQFYQRTHVVVADTRYLFVSVRKRNDLDYIRGSVWSTLDVSSDFVQSLGRHTSVGLMIYCIDDKSTELNFVFHFAFPPPRNVCASVWLSDPCKITLWNENSAERSSKRSPNIAASPTGSIYESNKTILKRNVFMVVILSLCEIALFASDVVGNSYYKQSVATAHFSLQKFVATENSFAFYGIKHSTTLNIRLIHSCDATMAFYWSWANEHSLIFYNVIRLKPKKHNFNSFQFFMRDNCLQIAENDRKTHHYPSAFKSF